VTENQKHFFFEHYGLSNQDLEKLSGGRLVGWGDYADIYFST
jgi:hypothetical protein